VYAEKHTSATFGFVLSSNHTSPDPTGHTTDKGASDMHRAISAIGISAAFLAATHWIVFAQGVEPKSEAPQVIEISAKKYEFSPNEIHVRKGTRVELKVHSEDETHGVKLDVYPEGSKDKDEPGLLFDEPKENGKVAKHVDQVLDFMAQKPGTYDFKCAKLCGLSHDHMKGKLIVDE
jgi:heme/copper-type cytochrome/quinol oxidase subunit 2